MDTLTIILVGAIVFFAIGNILLSMVLKRNRKGLFYGTSDSKIKVLNSKIDLLNKRVTRLEGNLKK